eukprot:4196021-Amphidinium_carterae.1
MDTQRDSDLLEQHSTLRTEGGMPGSNAPGVDPKLPFAEPAAAGLADHVPGQPAQPPVQDAPESLPPPGTPVARTGFQAALRPYSNGQGVPLTMHPEARPSPQVPAVGREVEQLGPEAGALLRQRRVAERR